MPSFPTGSSPVTASVSAAGGVVSYSFEGVPVDAQRMNVAALQGVSIPTERAEKLARTAYLAAKQYYDLFFEEPTSSPNVSTGPTGTDGGAARVPSTLVAGKFSPTASFSTSVASSSSTSSTSSRSSSAEKKHVAHALEKADPQAAAAAASDTHPAPPPLPPPHAGVLVPTVHVRNNVYHTFFPPTLTHRQRRSIMRRVIGRDRPRPFAQWPWRKAEEYHALHARTVAEHQGDAGGAAVAKSGVLALPAGAALAAQGPVAGAATGAAAGAAALSATATASLNSPHARADTHMGELYRSILNSSMRAREGEGAAPGASAATAETAAAETATADPDGKPPGAPLDPRDEESAVFTIPASRQGPEYFAKSMEDGTKTLIIVMVGLPARGKTFLAQKICRLLGWHGTKAKVQNIQVAWRRALLGRDDPRKRPDASHEDAPSPSPSPSPRPTGGDDSAAASSTHRRSACLLAEQFRLLLCDPASTERQVYRQVLESFAADCKQFFANGGEVVVVNDDFLTEGIRREAEELFKPLAGDFVYMEVIRDAEQNERFNASKVRDAAEYPRDRIAHRDAKKDFDARLKVLEELYEPLCDARDPAQPPAAPAAPGAAAESLKSYIKVRGSDRIETHGIHGYLASRIISYAMNLSQVKMQHPIYFVRHGESCYNLEDRIGGNPMLTAQGMRDSAALLEFMVSLKHHLQHVDLQQQQRQQQLQRARTSVAQQPLPPQQHGSTTPETAGDPRGSSYPASFNGSLAAMTPPLSVAAVSAPTPSAGAGAEASGPSHPTPGLLPLPLTPSVSASVQSPHLKVDNSSANNLEIWTSQLRRAIQTAELSERLLNIKTLRWSSLNEIHAGVCEDMTYAEVKKEYPLIDRFRKQSKYTFRYPDGESYQDLVVRLEPVIMELENADKVVVVVAHQAVLRCLLAYFGSTSAESSIRVQVPHRTVWRCTYDSKGIASLEEMRLDNHDAGFAPATVESTQECDELGSFFIPPDQREKDGI